MSSIAANYGQSLLFTEKPLRRASVKKEAGLLCGGRGTVKVASYLSLAFLITPMRCLMK